MQEEITLKTIPDTHRSDVDESNRDALELAKVGKKEVLKVPNPIRERKEIKTVNIVSTNRLLAKIWPSKYYRARMYCNVNMGGGHYVRHSPANDKESRLTGLQEHWSRVDGVCPF